MNVGTITVASRTVTIMSMMAVIGLDIIVRVLCPTITVPTWLMIFHAKVSVANGVTMMTSVKVTRKVKTSLLQVFEAQVCNMHRVNLYKST